MQQPLTQRLNAALAEAESVFSSEIVRDRSTAKAIGLKP
jgi:hypothetical protein